MRGAILLPLICGLAWGQVPQAKLSFEVVSIKPTAETMMSVMKSGRKLMQVDDAQVVIRAIELSGLVQMAYRLPDDQINGPAWMEEARFDITAKFPAGATQAQLPEMLQTMLAERFRMTVHHEEKVQPVYSLVLGKGPLQLKEAAGGDPQHDGCGGGRGGRHTCQKVTMEQFAEVLSRGVAMAGMTPVGETSIFLDRPVVDKTGLKGAYDFSMNYGRVGASGGRRGGGDAPAPDGEAMVPIRDAVKALGLALEPAKLPFDILVIDHIERVPAEN